MDTTTAYRAIIQLLGGNINEYKAIVGDYLSEVDVLYYYSKNNRIQGKLDTYNRVIRLADGQVIQCRH